MVYQTRKATAKAKAAVLGQLLTDKIDCKQPTTDPRYFMMTRHMNCRDAVTCMRLNKFTVAHAGNGNVLECFMKQLNEQEKEEKAKIWAVPEIVLGDLQTKVDNMNARIDAQEHNNNIIANLLDIFQKENRIMKTNARLQFWVILRVREEREKKLKAREKKLEAREKELSEKEARLFKPSGPLLLTFRGHTGATS